MVRKIIKINEDRCTGCGLCAEACHEGAIGMVNGKAKLLRDDYCDGLGNCLPVCPAEAITFEEREAAAYDEAAVQMNMLDKKRDGKCESQGGGNGSGQPDSPRDGHDNNRVGDHGNGHSDGHSNGHGRGHEDNLPCGCPGTQSKTIRHEKASENFIAHMVENKSQLSQWPVQIKLAPVNASYFTNANLLIAADCTAYAYGDFHNRFIKNKITLIGCPKLDSEDYSKKLTQIIKSNSIKTVTVVRMEVPCCGGIEAAVKTALQNSGKFIPWQVVTISTDGKIYE